MFFTRHFCCVGARRGGIGCLTVGILFSGCATLPKDPHHTLESVQKKGHLRTGLIENPPWVLHGAAGPDGVEVRLIREFATRIGALPEWSWSSEQHAVEALQCFELDVAIGGLESPNPPLEKVGASRPYFVEVLRVGVPEGQTAPDSLRGQHVFVLRGDSVAHDLEKRSAIPERVSEFAPGQGLAAAPEWRLGQLHLASSKFKLRERRHIVGVPPGENRWLWHLQQFLDNRAADVPHLLAQFGVMP